MNLDMIFWAATRLRDESMYAAALSHAKISQRYHVRDDYSTAHVVNFDPANGAIKSVITNQGYSDTSCWSRGQAWPSRGLRRRINGLRTNLFSRQPGPVRITL